MACPPFKRFVAFWPPPFHSLALGVRQNPYSVPLVRSAGVVRPHNSPSCIEPHRGKVSQDS
jgi:hypothetical protein